MSSQGLLGSTQCTAPSHCAIPSHRRRRWMRRDVMRPIHWMSRQCGIKLLLSLFSFYFLLLLLLPSSFLKFFVTGYIHHPARLSINNFQQSATSSSQVSFLFADLLPPHRFPLLSLRHCYDCFWIFFWMDLELCFWIFWNFDLFHTGPHVGTHLA